MTLMVIFDWADAGFMGQLKKIFINKKNLSITVSIINSLEDANLTRTNSTLAAMMRPVPATTADAVNYADFTFRAEVDWVEIYVRTEKPTNYWTVISLVGEKYAKPLDKDAGGAATRFMIKFQDPQSWQVVQDKIDALAVDHVLIEGPEVAAIEISFDAYSKFEFRDDLVAMEGRFYKYSQLVGHENRRMSTQGWTDKGPLSCLVESDGGIRPRPWNAPHAYDG